VGFLDRLRGREEKPEPVEARADGTTKELSTWLAALMQRLEADKIYRARLKASGIDQG